MSKEQKIIFDDMLRSNISSEDKEKIIKKLLLLKSKYEKKF